MDQPDAPCPAASIVIPLWNNVEYTRACLVRLGAATPAGTYEVVLVDNGSTDATAALLGAVSGDVRIIRNGTNLGFSRACNQGAAVARGRYLVFLNNDTEPHPGRLEPLVTVLDAEPDVGVVGSKLVFPSGLVQHAGVWVVGDEAGDEIHGYHRLNGSVPDDVVVDERADLQVVTGAALAIRRELFTELGGFDEGYWNGNEDVDLCLRVREAGFRVVYEPRSCLTHHESVSGPERFARAGDNVRRLVQRWSGRVALDAVGNHGAYRKAHAGSAGPAGTGPAAPPHPARGRLRHDAVHVVGHVGPGGRPGRTMELAADLLAAAGIPHDVSAYHRSWPWDAPAAYSLDGTGESCGIVVICVEPDALAGFVVGRGPRFVEDRYVIALWGWPDTSVPEAHLDALRMAHEFWVPSDALCGYAARVGAGAAVTLPPVPGAPTAVAPPVRAATGTADRLTFIATADLGAGVGAAHAGDDAALAVSAFTAAFGAAEEAALLVGISGGRHLPWRIEGLLARAGGDPRVAVLDLDSAGITGDDLAAAGDCYVALLGARGYPWAALAAARAGTPVVAMTHPTNPELLTPSNAYLVDPAGDEATLVSRAAEVMSRVAADPADRVARGRLVTADIQRRGDRARAVKLVRDRVGRAERLLDELAQVPGR